MKWNNMKIEMKFSPVQYICVLGLEKCHQSLGMQGCHLSHGDRVYLSSHGDWCSYAGCSIPCTAHFFFCDHVLVPTYDVISRYAISD